MNPVRRVVLAVLGVALLGVILYQLQVPLHQNAGRFGAAFRDIADEGAVHGGQLPSGFEPLAYRLHFDLEATREFYTGHAEIEVRLAKSCRVIPLHGKRLNVTRARVFTPAGEAIAAHYQEVGPHGDARLVLRKDAPAGTVTLAIDYEAAFSDAMDGIYRVATRDASYVLTHFQAMSARQAFPSFDEPRFRTPFHLSLVVGDADMAVSNTPLAVERHIGSGRRLLVFQPTPPLPSHLVAFVSGPLQMGGTATMPTSPLRGHAVALRAFSLSDDAGEVTLELAETESFVFALEDYVSVPYPFPKLDFIAVPGIAAAASYPGVILYPADMPQPPAKSKENPLRRFDEQQVDVLTQQWLGNLVTPADWNQWWFGQSLVRWLSYRTLQALRPNLGFGQELQQGARAAMTADAAPGVLPLRHDEAADMAEDVTLDAFRYEKGAAVLNMFEAMVGPEKFRAIVRHYVRAHAYKAVTVSDFLKSVTESLGEDGTAAALRTFMDQPGVPLVTVDWSCPQQGVSVAVTQERFTPLGQPVAEDVASRPVTSAVWGIPLCFRMTAANDQAATQCMLATRATQTFYLRQQTCPQALVPNADGRGYYYWRIAGSQAGKLGDVLSRLSPGEVLSYADSLSAAFRAGQLTVPEYLAAIRPLASSSQWEAVVRPLDDLRFLLRYAVPQEDAAIRAARAVVADIYRARLEIGMQETSGSTGAREIHRRLLDLYVRDLEDPGLLTVLADQGRRYMGYQHAKPDYGAAERDMAALAVSAALMVDGHALVPFLKQHLLEKVSGPERQAILAGWALAFRADVAAAFLHYLADPATPVADVQQGLALIADNPAARPQLWMWVAEHGLQLAARLPAWVKGDVVAVVGAYCDAIRADMASQSFAVLAENTGEPGRLQNAITEIRQCAALKDAVADDVRQVLRLPPLPPADQTGSTPASAAEAKATQIPD